MVLMRLQIGVVERQGRRRVWRMVLVWLACLCRRSMVSCWRRFPLVPWRHSFSSRPLLPIINRPSQDGIVKHGNRAYGLSMLSRRLPHGRQAAGTGGGTRSRRGGDGRVNAPQSAMVVLQQGDGCGCLDSERGSDEDGMGAGVEQLCLDHTHTHERLASQLLLSAAAAGVSLEQLRA